MINNDIFDWIDDNIEDSKHNEQSVNNTERNDKKNEITDKLVSDESYIKILNVFKNINNSCLKIELDNYNLNGLCTYIHVIFNKEQSEIVKIIVPIFSSSKTVTWSSKYMNLILDALKHTDLIYIEEEISNKILLSIFIYDTDINDYAFIQVCNLNDFVKSGITGKNSYGNNINKYKWLDTLPDKYALKLKDIEGQLFKYFLINATNEQLTAYSVNHALENKDNYYNPSNRDEKKLISNIATGVFIEMKHASTLLNKLGENYVNINNVEQDDKGVDITIELNNKTVNLDVKSTKSTNLSIRSNRTDTDFYAVYSTNTKYKKPKFFGYISKNVFWGDKTLKIPEPTQYRDTYIKSLNELKDYFIQDETMLIHEQSKNKLREFKNKSCL